MSSLSRHLKSEIGAGTVIAVAILAGVLGVFGVGQVAVQQLIRHEQLQVLADNMALTATDAVRGLTLGYPCDLARQLAAENMVNLDECRIVGFEAFISIRSNVVGIVLIANARAGPS